MKNKKYVVGWVVVIIVLIIVGIFVIKNKGVWDYYDETKTDVVVEKKVSKELQIIIDKPNEKRTQSEKETVLEYQLESIVKEQELEKKILLESGKTEEEIQLGKEDLLKKLLENLEN